LQIAEARRGETLPPVDVPVKKLTVMKPSGLPLDFFENIRSINADQQTYSAGKRVSDIMANRAKLIELHDS